MRGHLSLVALIVHEVSYIILISTGPVCKLFINFSALDSSTAFSSGRVGQFLSFIEADRPMFTQYPLLTSQWLI